jgi:hypothetical protein
MSAHSRFIRASRFSGIRTPEASAAPTIRTTHLPRQAMRQQAQTKPSPSGRASPIKVAAYVESECVRLKEDTEPMQWAKADHVYQDYRAWALRSGHSPMSLVKFGERMQGLGLGSNRQGRGCLYPVRTLLKGENHPSNEECEQFLEN